MRVKNLRIPVLLQITGQKITEGKKQRRLVRMKITEGKKQRRLVRIVDFLRHFEGIRR